MKKIELYEILGATAKRLHMDENFIKGLALDCTLTNGNAMQSEITSDVIAIVRYLCEAETLEKHTWYWIGAAINALSKNEVENKGE